MYKVSVDVASTSNLQIGLFKEVDFGSQYMEKNLKNGGHAIEIYKA